MKPTYKIIINVNDVSETKIEMWTHSYILSEIKEMINDPHFKAIHDYEGNVRCLDKHIIAIRGYDKNKKKFARLLTMDEAKDIIEQYDLQNGSNLISLNF